MTKERDELDHRIALMQETVALLEGAKRGPGRPPGSKNKATADNGASASRASKKKKRNWSPEARAAAAERMRKTWRKRKRQAQASRTK